MKHDYWKILSCAVVGLTACSNPPEDVRITFCKNLTQELLKPAPDIQWHASEQRLKRLDHAAIILALEIHDQAGQTQTMQATCRYAYDAVDDTAMTLSNPLSAYSTVPYEMALNDLRVSEPTLRKAIQAAQLAMGQAVVEGIKQGIQDGVQRLKSDM
jgi:hypothetical protein